MTETAAIGTPPLRIAPSTRGSEDAPVFSFASAVSAMETQAARSLEAHGATPNKTATIGETATQTRQAPQTPYAQSERAAATEPEKAQSTKSEPATTGAATQQQSAAVSGAVQGSQTVANAIAIAPQVAAATAPAQSAVAVAKVDALAVRAADIAKASAAKEAKAPAPAHKPDAPTQDFAKLLARRLDAGATQFELRLDPPSLGRVEAQLKLGDEGENVLALKFEHQAALDLFANDQAALRNSLGSAGFEFDNNNVVFKLADDADMTAAASSSSEYEPFFAAPWSTGAVDISI